MQLFLGQFINGLTIGSTYALVALGIVLIFSVLDVMSVAQGQIFVAAAYIGFVWVYGFTQDMVLAAVVVVIAALVLGGFTERLAVRPALRGGHLATLITTVGVGLVLSNAIQIIAGPYAKVVHNDSAVRALFQIGGVNIRPIEIASLGVLIAGFLALKVVTERTRIGAQVRAVAENGDIAAAFGVNVQRIRFATFAIGSGLAGLAAVLLALKYGNLTPDLGINFSLKGLTAAIIGGAARVEGALVAAFGLAITETMTTAYLGADYSNLVGFILLFVVLLLRSEGIFQRTYRRAG